MKCVICNKTIGKNDPKSYVIVHRGEKPRKVYACTKCNGDAFDNWIDSLSLDDDGRLIAPAARSRQARLYTSLGTIAADVALWTKKTLLSRTERSRAHPANEKNNRFVVLRIHVASLY